MTRTGFLIIATAALTGAIPGVAHASCSGSACSAFSFDGSRFTNKDKVYMIQLKGCFIQKSGTCGSPPVTFDILIDPNSTKSVSAPSSLGSNVKVDVQSASFAGELKRPHVQTLPNGNTDLVEPKAIKVTNDGKVPLKVVILDAVKFSELGRTPDYKTGTFVVDLNQHVSKYHWEVFAPGDKEPCQKLRDETKPAITVHCDHTKESEKLPPLPMEAKVGGIWAEKCNVNGAGGPKDTCCARLRMAEPHCKQPPGFPPSVATGECDTAEQMCRMGLNR